jgi:uncharacterized membrane protein YqjE
MELDPSQGARASEPSSLDSLQDFAAAFLRYLELRLQLLGLESRESGIHLLILALLFVSVLVCFGGFVIMLVVFLLYLMMLILHWEWGWSALALGGVLLLISIGMAVIFRFRIAKPFFPQP